MNAHYHSLSKGTCENVHSGVKSTLCHNTVTCVTRANTVSSQDPNRNIRPHNFSHKVVLQFQYLTLYKLLEDVFSKKTFLG